MFEKSPNCNLQYFCPSKQDITYYSRDRYLTVSDCTSVVYIWILTNVVIIIVN